jgi:hypothetical protein
MQYHHKNKEILRDTTRWDITEYVHTFLLELARRETYPPKIIELFDANRIKELLNAPNNTIFKSITDFKTGRPYWDKQLVDCVPSNLGDRKGYIFYFICNECGRRTKYLYEYSMLSSPLCRICCRLSYKREPRKKVRKQNIGISWEQEYAKVRGSKDEVALNHL